MGLIQAAKAALGSTVADQWREYFYCESLPADTIAVKGRKRTGAGSSNHGADNIISNGSIVAVADGQCMLIVDQGKVVEVCAEPGEFVYDASSEPTILYGGLKKDNILGVFKNIGKRFTFGGDIPKDQRIYYFNTKEIMGNKYGTPNTVPFRVVDRNINLDMDVNIRCFGEYSYRVTNPLLFYTNVCGNVNADFKKSEIDSMMKTELLSALQPAFARISEMGIRYSSLPGHTNELSNALNEELSNKWRDLRGIEIVAFGVASVKADEEDEKMIKELQKNAAFKDPTMAAAYMVGAQANAIQEAAKNTSAGPAMAFMGMNMAQNAAGGNNINNLYAMGQQQQQQQYGQPQQQQYSQPQQPQQQAAPAGDTWTCPSCNSPVTGKFCPECGTKKPEPQPAAAPAADGWSCPSCGTLNKGKFCLECGTKKPAGVPQYKCDKCGWEPADPKNPPKFCPECGDPFGDEDIVQ